ncbi:MAG: S8 family serine peptidase [Candidatus Competibacterales bacterium]|nr:S8 family serine peptidase [Candidatus Competibacterales bacterium]
MLAIGASAGLLERIRATGFVITRREELPNLGLSVVRLRAPLRVTAPEALTRLRREFPAGEFALNHVYDLEAGPCEAAHCYASQLINWPLPAASSCGAGLRVGMVDTAVDTGHPALRGHQVVVRHFADNGRPSDPAHGTAVAALLVGRAGAGFPGLLPGAELVAADAFKTDARGRDRTTAYLLARALDWLLDWQVAAVNMSMAGPANPLLEKAVRAYTGRDQPLVAAAGNGGPDAPPAYPAAYPGVLAVTAVDQRLRLYRYANRGDYVALAAPGVAIWTPAPDGGGEYRNGTSFAAPFVTAVVADLRARESLPLAGLNRRLRDGARDLGAPGRDALYGWGLVRSPVRCGG